MIKSPKLFAAIIKCDIKAINETLEDIKNDEELFKSRGPVLHEKLTGKSYYRWSKPKKGNKLRTFHVSAYNLRNIQEKICTRIFSHIQLPYFLTGSLKKRSGAINVKIHAKNNHFLRTDLVGYFDFVTVEKVYASMKSLNFSDDVAQMITRLTTINNRIPQGCPTSPFLANLTGLPMDLALVEKCKQLGLTYSRYVDDVVISAVRDFRIHSKELLDVFEIHGLLFNYNKTFYKVGKIEFTGVQIFNGGIRVTEDQLSRMYSQNTPNHTRKGLIGYACYIEKTNATFDIDAYKSAFQHLKFPPKLSTDSSFKNLSTDVKSKFLKGRIDLT